MKLWLTGLNHRTAPVEVRERLAFTEGGLSDALMALRQEAGILEALILSTCNRVEVAVAAAEDTDARETVARFLCRRRDLDRSWLEPHLYEREGHEAIRHIFRVASSVDSMIVGEPQILGQMKAAYAAAKSSGTLAGLLETVLARAFGVAKRVRTETDIGTCAVSVSYAAVELAREIFGSLEDRRVMVIGAGKMAELAARHLHRCGADIVVTNRTAERAHDLALVINGGVIPYDSFPSHLKDVDIVVASSGACGYVLGKQDIKKALEARRNRPMFLIDIAVPRNIDPEANQLDNAFIYDIDDLQRVVTKNLKSRLDAATEADRIIEEEVERLETWMRTRSVGPVIVDLQEQLEKLRLAEVERMHAKLGTLTPQQQQAVDQLTRSLINKIAHGPIAALRRNAEDPTIIERIRNIFRLDEESEPARLRGK